jgi:hypothetical protein
LPPQDTCIVHQIVDATELAQYRIEDALSSVEQSDIAARLRGSFRIAEMLRSNVRGVADDVITFMSRLTQGALQSS